MSNPKTWAGTIGELGIYSTSLAEQVQGCSTGTSQLPHRFGSRSRADHQGQDRLFQAVPAGISQVSLQGPVHSKPKLIRRSCDLTVNTNFSEIQKLPSGLELLPSLRGELILRVRYVWAFQPGRYGRSSGRLGRSEHHSFSSTL